MIKFNGTLDKDFYLKRLKELARDYEEPPPPPVLPQIKKQVGRFVYLPVEVKSRDLPSRAKLAGELAELGFEVIIGAIWEIMANDYRDLPPGIILHKTMNYFDAVNMWKASKCGHVNAVLNEELFSVRPEKKIYQAHIYPQAQPDLICAQGEAQERLLHDMGYQAGLAGTHRGTGGGGPQGGETNQILICLMTGNCNGILPFEQYMRVAFNALGRSTGPVYDLVAEQIEHECDTHPLILECANDLSSTHKDKQIIIRPHPVENPAIYWTDGNCTMDSRISIGERLRSVDEMYYVSGCGTGLDAKFAGVRSTRVGTGGQGLSALDEPLDKHFSPCRLAQVLDDYQRANSRHIRTTPARAFQMRRVQFQPIQFHLDKFPHTWPEEVHPAAYQIGWNLFSIPAASDAA